MKKKRTKCINIHAIETEKNCTLGTTRTNLPVRVHE